MDGVKRTDLFQMDIVRLCGGSMCNVTVGGGRNERKEILELGS